MPAARLSSPLRRHYVVAISGLALPLWLWHSFPVFETKTNVATADVYLGVVEPVALPGSTHTFASAIEYPIISVGLFARRSCIHSVYRASVRFIMQMERTAASQDANVSVYWGWLGSSVGRAED